jgi:hypothetical protein
MAGEAGSANGSSERNHALITPKVMGKMDSCSSCQTRSRVGNDAYNKLRDAGVA